MPCDQNISLKSSTLQPNPSQADVSGGKMGGMFWFPLLIALLLLLLLLLEPEQVDIDLCCAMAVVVQPICRYFHDSLVYETSIVLISIGFEYIFSWIGKIKDRLKNTSIVFGISRFPAKYFPSCEVN